MGVKVKMKLGLSCCCNSERFLACCDEMRCVWSKNNFFQVSPLDSFLCSFHKKKKKRRDKEKLRRDDEKKRKKKVVPVVSLYIKKYIV